MKAVIVEIKDNIAIVLSEDGRIVKIKNNDFEIGQEIPMNNKTKLTRTIVSFAASAAALAVLAVGSWAYASPYSYVSLDVNPSIEYTLNRFDRVLRVAAINDDGEEIIHEISLSDLEHRTIQDALLKTVEQITVAGYFDESDECGIVITTSGKNSEKAEELANQLQETVEAEVEDNSNHVVVESESVGLDRVERARELGVTPGKLNLVEKLQDSSEDPNSIDIEEWLNKPVKDIMKATKNNKKGNSQSDTDVSIEDQVKTNENNTAIQTKELKDQEKALQKAEKEAAKAKEKEAKEMEKASKSTGKELNNPNNNNDKNSNSANGKSSHTKPDNTSNRKNNNGKDKSENGIKDNSSQRPNSNNGNSKDTKKDEINTNKNNKSNSSYDKNSSKTNSGSSSININNKNTQSSKNNDQQVHNKANKNTNKNDNKSSNNGNNKGSNNGNKVK